MPHPVYPRPAAMVLVKEEYQEYRVEYPNQDVSVDLTRQGVAIEPGAQRKAFRTVGMVIQEHADRHHPSRDTFWQQHGLILYGAGRGFRLATYSRT
jgi:hypothetical protein